MSENIEEILQKERTPLPMTNQKIWDMAKLIVDRQKAANRVVSDKIQWTELEGDWFDWLEEQLFGEQD